MGNELVLRHDGGHVARLTLNAPQSFNALSDEMLEALAQHLGQIHTDANTRVVVIEGAGRAFCAGHDLRQMQQKRSAPDGGRAALGALFARCSQVMGMIRALPQPVIAQVHGVATAAGCQLVATCDLAVAAENARFGVNGVNIGLFCSTPMVALTRNITPKAAFEMLSTGEFINAQRALELGLINRVSPLDDLTAQTDALAQSLAQKLPAALRYGKAAFYAQAGLPVEAAYAQASAVMIDNLMEEATNEGMTAFLEKRAPNWAL